MKKILTICVILILSFALLSCGGNNMTEEEKQSIIAEYLISPDKNPREIFDFIKEWNLEAYYEKVRLDK